MSLTSIQNLEDFQKLKTSETPVFFYFTASWCGPCKFITPKIEAFALKYTTITFFKIDIDDNPDPGEEENLKHMPAFLIYKSDKKLEELYGANLETISLALEKHA